MGFNGLPQSRRRRGWTSRIWIVVGATVVALAATDARATSLTLTAPSPTFFDSLPPDEVCVNPKTGLPGPQYINCRVASFLALNDGVAFGLKDTFFDKAFNNWNNDGSWTLKDGGALPGGSLQVTNFRTVANRGGTIAGVDILVNWTYDGADKSDFLWTQGLFDNYKKDGTIGPSIYELDVRTDCDNADLTKLCGPAYPLQSEDRKFDDAPRAPWPDGSFAGFAYLSKVDRDKKVLTVYEGVVYGFSLTADPKPEVLPEPSEVPEPAPLTLVVTGMTTLWALRRRAFVRARVLRVVAISLLAAIPLLAAQDQSFEVASIKRNNSGDRNSLLRVLPGGRLSATNFSVRSLINFAWQLAPFQVVGGPDWINSDGYDIVAKLDGNPVIVEPGKGLPDPRQIAVRNLLADRFKLKTHLEMREMDIYALVIAKPGGAPGPKLIPSPQDCATQAAAARGQFPPQAPGPPPELGKAYCGIAGSNGRIRFGGLNSAMMAQAFNGPTQRMVVDRTGLAGSWDFDLRFVPRSRGVDASPADPDLPDFFTAVQEQLGLKLESTKGSVEVLVIDSVERPTED